ncbi:hypothetical protein ES319_A10G237100v1 [Gossypium barbadense]|uniref:Reverse transcriptase zinc-binding domain-containing protein n=1 Tax=Gossypium barbadense TaxID=3634 RepID=A0A5J5U6V2_GOSBA|nr:hypothetical protein ES319_A10G237100v1 [Gossypium barbadense]
MVRQIFYGILIANELIHSIRCKGGAGEYLLWDFLDLILLKMGFGECWTGWMVEFNGAVINEFRLHRGLRQGDPLSPFLFILNAEKLGMIEGIKDILPGQSISHLQAEEAVVLNSKYILRYFELFSGLSINFGKSCLVGFCVDEEFLSRMAAICKCKIGVFPFNYLGIPLGADPRKISSWNGIVDRVERKLSGWKSRSLSWAGRVVLINSVLLSLPIYFMSLFQAPVGGSAGGRRKLAKVKWKQICMPKVKGGAGVVDLRVKNKSLIAKWIWRFTIDKEVLWRRIIAAKYGTAVQNWRGILENAKDSKVAKWVGNESFRWLDIWCGDRPLRVEFPRLFRLSLNKSGFVKDFSKSNDREVNMVSRLMEAVYCMVLIPEVEDRLIWIHDKQGEFSMRKLSELLICAETADFRFAFDRIWNLKVPPKVKSFLWTVSIDRIPTKEFLSKRGVKFGQLGIGCPWCEREIESLEHLLFNCNFIAGFWRNILENILEWWEVKWRPFVDFSDFFFFCNNISYKGVVKSLWLISVSTACWSAWLARNELVFEKRWPKMSNLVFLTKIRALMWIRAVYDELKVDEKIWVKFNVSGVESEGDAGCGGVLRNSEGVVRAMFSGLCAARESSAAEVGVVCLALEVFLEMGWKGSCSLAIEVGSSDVFCWLENKVDKHGNAMTFVLAAAGLKRQKMFKAWW